MFTIIGTRYTRPEFAAYVAGIKLTGTFQPKFIVLHNTAVPNLADRPNGWTPAAIKSLHDFYVTVQKWLGGPHLFIDDKEDGIVVFNPLNIRGTHSPAWNTEWGIEMLGDYAKDEFTTGRGAKVAANAAFAAAILLDKIDAVASHKTIRLHKEDPVTTHKGCPGKNVVKADFVRMVQTFQEDLDAAGSYRLFLNATELGPTWQNPADAGRNYYALRLLLNKLHGAEDVSRKLAATATGATWEGKPIPAQIVAVDGVKNVQLAAFAIWQNLVLDRNPNTRTITLKRGTR